VHLIVRAAFLAVILGAASAGAQPVPRWVTDPRDSARESALELLALLSQGDIRAAAQLSNAPQRRYEVLRDYRDSVGEESFRQAYGHYLDPSNRLLAEAALGPRRLLIWRLGGKAQDHIAGQFFIEVDGRFLLDDVPSAERASLQRVLQDYRKADNR
jgi:hypothetical protein